MGANEVFGLNGLPTDALRYRSAAEADYSGKAESYCSADLCAILVFADYCTTAYALGFI